MLIALCLFALAFAVAIFAAATAHAAYYKTLYCTAADGSGNPTLGARPGFFDFTDDCGTAYGDPAGTSIAAVFANCARPGLTELSGRENYLFKSSIWRP